MIHEGARRKHPEFRPVSPGRDRRSQASSRGDSRVHQGDHLAAMVDDSGGNLDGDVKGTDPCARRL
jgi:hypothetical protein